LVVMAVVMAVVHAVLPLAIESALVVIPDPTFPFLHNLQPAAHDEVLLLKHMLL